MKKWIPRIVAAICFLPLLITSVQQPFRIHIIDSANVLAVVASMLPIVSCFLIILGLLLTKPTVSLIGLILQIVINLFSFPSYLYLVQQTGIWSPIITTALTTISYLLLLFCCLVRRRSLSLGIAAAAVSAGRSVFSFLTAASGNIQALSVLAMAGFLIGSVLMGWLFQREPGIAAVPVDRDIRAMNGGLKSESDSPDDAD